MSGASVEFGDVDHQSWRCLLKRNLAGCSLNFCDGRGERLSEATNSGDHHHHQRGQVLQTSVRGLGIRIQQAGNKQLVPVGATVG